MIAMFRPSGLLALVALVILAPLLLLLAAVVWFSVGRPILFRQKRSGRGGVPFEMVKFRSMRDMRDASGAPLPDRDRTTRVGGFLRRSRLDELPELLNILCGQMDFVGPRPLLPQTVTQMGPDGMIRGSVRPGLTGLAQVNGNSLLSAQEKLAFDLIYVRHGNPVLDAMILFRTVWVVIVGERRTRWHA